jgi:serine/threonine protein kinase
MPAGAAQLTPECGALGPVPVVHSERGEPFSTGLRIGGRYDPDRPISPRGNVWLAHDRSGRSVALKTGPGPLIERERRILTSVTHPNIVRLVDAFTAKGSAVLVLEHLSGGDFVSLAGFDSAHWLEQLAQLIAALDSLHAAGIVHRDLKARNVMVDGMGRSRLIDFGSAEQVGSRWTLGGTTADAVEPGRGATAVTADDDIYALSVLIYELLHGAPPGRGAQRPGIPKALAALVASALAPASAAPRPGLDRFATVIESLHEPLQS